MDKKPTVLPIAESKDSHSTLSKVEQLLLEAKGQFSSPAPCLPNVQDEVDDEEQIQPDVLLDLEPNNSNDLFNQSSEQQSNPSGTGVHLPKVISAQEAYRIYTRASSFDKIFESCDNFIHECINRCLTSAIFTGSTVLVSKDLWFLMRRLEELHYTVVERTNGYLKIDWHNKFTHNLSTDQLDERSRQHKTQQQLASTCFSAYDACLKEIHRDERWIEQVLVMLDDRLDRQIRDAVDNERRTVTFDVPIPSLLQNSPRHDHHSKLLQHAFRRFIEALKTQTTYIISDVLCSSSKMKFKLTLPGFMHHFLSINSHNSTTSTSNNTSRKLTRQAPSFLYKSKLDPIDIRSALKQEDEQQRQQRQVEQELVDESKQSVGSVGRSINTTAQVEEQCNEMLTVYFLLTEKWLMCKHGLESKDVTEQLKFQLKILMDKYDEKLQRMHAQIFQLMVKGGTVQ